MHEGFIFCKILKNPYLRMVLRASMHVKRFNTLRETAMCKRSTVDTYLKVNALHDNAQPCVFPFTIIVGHILC